MTSNRHFFADNSDNVGLCKIYGYPKASGITVTLLSSTSEKDVLTWDYLYEVNADGLITKIEDGSSDRAVEYIDTLTCSN